MTPTATIVLRVLFVVVPVAMARLVQLWLSWRAEALHQRAEAERLARLLAHEKARQPVYPPPGYEARPAGPDPIDVANLVTEHDGWRRAALTAGTKLEESIQAQVQMILDLATALGHGDSATPVAFADLVAEAARLRARAS